VRCRIARTLVGETRRRVCGGVDLLTNKQANCDCYQFETFFFVFLGASLIVVAVVVVDDDGVAVAVAVVVVVVDGVVAVAVDQCCGVAERTA
jgi:hypothetical protein